MFEPNAVELPSRDGRDTTHDLVKLGMSILSLDAAGVFDLLLTPPFQRRLDDWRRDITEKLNALYERGELSIEALSASEVFQTTLINATLAATRTHQEKKRRSLRNAVLNSALPGAPDEIRQEMFIRWLDEMTAWHILILALFDRPHVPEIEIDSPDWVMNVARDHLADFIQRAYPEMRGHSPTYFTIVQDLHSKALIANKVPEIGVATRMDRSPKVTPLGKEFLEFITSPLDVDPDPTQ